VTTERIIAIGDIHGCFGLLMSLMEDIDFKPGKDLLVFLGDYIDRGSQSREVVEYLTNLRSDHPDSVVLLLGNHEDMALKSTQVSRDIYDWHRLWRLNGGDWTLMSYNGKEDALMEFIKTLKLYHRVENYLFVHASLPLGVDPDNIDEADDADGILWDRMHTYDGPIDIIAGHTIQDSGSIGQVKSTTLIDMGSFCYGKLIGLDVKNYKIYGAYAA
jgi:serine/threonine protein phosphatase 1